MIPTIDDLLGYEEAAKFRERIFPGTYEVFVTRIYNDIESIINEIQDSANYQEKSEDLLTIQIVHMLSMMKYSAGHDNNTRGHVDIVVQKGTYKWIGEAKIFSGGYDWLFKGVTQLMTRYTTGTEGQTETALLIYFFEEKVKDKMFTWQEKFKEKSAEPEFIDGIGFKNIDCSIDTTLQFTSHHTHSISQFDMSIRHIPVLLYHKPLDSLVGKTKA